MAKQLILNYEVEMMGYHSQSMYKPQISSGYQYTEWQLNKKINQILPTSCSYSIHWIGNHDTSYLDSFIYVLLSLGLKSENTVLKMKQQLYQLSQKFLSKQGQKLIVQFLCLIQYTQNKFNFLRKHFQVVKLLVQILKYYQSQVLSHEITQKQNSLLESSTKSKKKYHFHILASKFNFINFDQINEHTYKFSCHEDSIFLVVQKNCFFNVQIQPQTTNIKKDSKRKKQNKTEYSYATSKGHAYPVSEKNLFRNQIIYKSKRSENFSPSDNQSPDCSLKKILYSLKNVQSNSTSQRTEGFKHYKTQKHIESPTKITKKKGPSSEKSTLMRLKMYQQQRQRHWLMIEKEYYQRKKQICRKTQGQKLINNEIAGITMVKSKYQVSNSEKQRKISINSFSGISVKNPSDSGDSDYDKASFTKSQGDSYNKHQQLIRSRKASMKQPSQNRKTVKFNKSNKRQNIVNEQPRLSIIQEQNRIKFWDFQNKISNHQKLKKMTSFNSSERETFDPNYRVVLNYVNNKPQNNDSILYPHVQKMNYYGIPIKV